MEYLVQEETLSAIADKIREKTGIEGDIIPEAMPQGVEDTYAAGAAVGDAEIQQIDRRMDGLLIAEDIFINGDPDSNLFNESLFAEDGGEYGNLYWADGTAEFTGPPSQGTNFALREYAPGLTIGKTYTFSYDGSRGDIRLGASAPVENPITFVLTEDIYNAPLVLLAMYQNEVGDYTYYVSRVMLNVGSVALPYVPYSTAFTLRRGAASVLSKIETAEENLPLIRAAGKEEGEREGYNQGHIEGFSSGREQGYTEGYDYGSIDGYRDGLYDGHAAGYDEGYKAGYEWGNESGYSQGYTDGVEATKPLGTATITENGTHDVESYQFAEVAVPPPAGYLKPEGTLNIAKNGEYDVKQYAKVKVAMPTEEWVFTLEDGSTVTKEVEVAG